MIYKDGAKNFVKTFGERAVSRRLDFAQRKF
jgi:hypothetical protein